MLDKFIQRIKTFQAYVSGTWVMLSGLARGRTIKEVVFFNLIVLWKRTYAEPIDTDVKLKALKYYEGRIQDELIKSGDLGLASIWEKTKKETVRWEFNRAYDLFEEYGHGAGLEIAVDEVRVESEVH